MWIVALALCLQAESTFRDPTSGEVTLTCDYSELVEHSKLEGAGVIGDMAVYQGRLFTTGVHEYSVADDSWVRKFNGSTMFMLRVAAGTLMSPHWSGGAVRVFDGEKTRELVLPGGHLHTMDVVEFDKKLYASTGSMGCGKVFESSDGGATWKQIRSTKQDGRVLDMVVFKGKLYANERGEHLICWDGKTWTELPVQLPVKEKIDAKLGNAHLFVFKDKIIATNIGLYYTYDGKKWDSKTRSFADLWVEGDELYGLTEDGHVEISRNAKDWRRLTKKGIPTSQISGADAPEGSRPMRPLQIGSIAIHRKRLFAGTSVQGRIYASPYRPEGSFVSESRALPPGYELRLASDSVVPEGTTLGYDVRTASAKETLDRAPWKELGPDAKIEAGANHRWMQWRARLESDGGKTPVVRGVKVVPAAESK